MAKRGENETLVVDVHNRLRAEILGYQWVPGERIKPAELRVRLGVSIGVLREALGLLAAENLVRIAPNRGFHVATLSPVDLINLTLVRKLNEGAALGLAIGRGDIDWESEVLASHHRMVSVPTYLPEDPPRRNEAWAVAHTAFHAKLLDACGNDILIDICARLSGSAELYRGWSALSVLEGERDIVAEHLELMESTLARDAERAVSLLKAHIDRTAEVVMKKVVSGSGGQMLRVK